MSDDCFVCDGAGTIDEVECKRCQGLGWYYYEEEKEEQAPTKEKDLTTPQERAILKEEGQDG